MGCSLHRHGHLCNLRDLDGDHAPQDEAQREALKAGKGSGEGASDMEKAADFGRLRTMKVQEATRVRSSPPLPCTHSAHGRLQPLCASWFGKLTPTCSKAVGLDVRLFLGGCWSPTLAKRSIKPVSCSLRLGLCAGRVTVPEQAADRFGEGAADMRCPHSVPRRLRR